MNTIDDFVQLLHLELGLPVTAEDLDASFDQLPDWDSLHMLSLLTLLERRTGRQMSLPDALKATTLNDVYALAVNP